MDYVTMAASRKQRRATASNFSLEELESRVLFSADLPIAALGVIPTTPVFESSSTDNQPNHITVDKAAVDGSEHSTARELVIIDGGVIDIDAMLADLQLNSQSNPHVVVMDNRAASAEDALKQLSAIFEQYHGLQAVHLISHGAAGELSLAGETIDTMDLLSHAATIESWRDAFTEDGDLLIYGCDVAAGTHGGAFVEALSLLSGADVAASTDITGGVKAGGDWTLEAKTGLIERSIAFSDDFQQSYTESFATYQVSSLADSGAGSLREAIDFANASVGTADIIEFDIAGTIALITELPTIIDTLTIDGTTAPGYVDSPVVTIDGNAISGTSDKHGLVFDSGSDGSTVKGLSIVRFNLTDSAGIVLQNAGNHIIESNYIGTDGSSASANWYGLNILNSAGNTIGGVTVAKGNLISGNLEDAIEISGTGSFDNNVQNNRIGTNANGTVVISNAYGIYILGGAYNNKIGGTGTDTGNLISGNGRGIYLGGAGDGNVIAGNIIGLAADGKTALSNQGTGVLLVNTDQTQIGADGINYVGNVISGSEDNGISITGASSSNTISGNYIGTDSSGTLVRGNGENGIHLSSTGSGNSIGGITASEQNTIAYNASSGILVTNANSTANSIVGNSIHSNVGLGIDLNNDGVSANDSGDGDTGPNSLQNWAELTSASTNDSGVFSYEIDTTTLANGTYTIDFYASAQRDSGRVEGERFLARVTGIAGGNSAVTGTLTGISLLPGEFATLITTDASGNSSEFSSYAYISDGDSNGLSPEDIKTTETSNGGLDINNDGGDDIYLIADDGDALLGGQRTLSFETQFASPATADRLVLVSYAVDSNSNEVFMSIRGDGELGFFIGDDTLRSNAFDYNTLRDGTQHSIGFTWDGTTGFWAIYADGVKVDSTAISAGLLLDEGGTIEGGGVLLFGQDQDIVKGDFDNTQEFVGTLYNARFFSDVRSDSEMAANYQSELPIDEAGMLAQWNFDRLSVDGVITDSVSGNNLLVKHTDEPGFTASEALLTLSLDENTPDGTVVGRVTGVDPQRKAQIADLLATDTDLRYSAETNKFYKLATATDQDFATAAATVASTSLEGITSQFVTIRSAFENELVRTHASEATDIWLGGSDTSVEGEWRWQASGADADQFWYGLADGHSTGYSNWVAGQPNYSSADYAVMDTSEGMWSDRRAGSAQFNAVFVEWNADTVLNVAHALSYSIQSQTVAGAFEIDSDSGTISLAKNALLNAAMNATHDVTVYVEDVNGLGYSELVTIAINDLVQDTNLLNDLSSGIEVNADGGNDAYLVADDGGAILGNASQFTIETQFSTYDNNQVNLVSYLGADGRDDLSVVIEPDGTLKVIVDNVSASGLSGIDYNQLRDGHLHNLALSWDNTHGNWSVYVDGTLADSGTGLSIGGTLDGSAGTGTLVFGQELDTLSGDFDSSTIFSGTYSDVRIWNTVRTSSEISINHQSKLNLTALEAANIGLVANWQMDGFNGSGEVVDSVVGNNLSVGDAGDGGTWISSKPTGDLHIIENATGGTEVGYVVPGSIDVGLDVVSDGLFTEAIDPGASTSYNNASALGDWTVSSSGGGVVHLGTSAEETPLGGNSVHLNQSVDGGGINQTLDVEVGREYQVVFALSGWHVSDQLYKEVRVSAGGVSHDFGHEYTTDWATSNLLWGHRSFNFTADSATQTLSFESLNLSGDGAIIADVQVIEIPQAIVSILANEPSLNYDAATGKFYRFFDTPKEFTNQLIAANTDTLNGVNGNLVRIDSHYENELVRQYAIDSGNDIWLAATDTNNDGNWNWLNGTTESTDQFWTGGSTGSATDGYYVPIFDQSESIGENFVSLKADGTWADDTEDALHSYVVQWDAAEVLSNFQFDVTEQDALDAALFAVESDGGIRLADPKAPEDYSDHVVQIDASDSASITQSASAVSAISDTSGTGNHATQATSGSQPILVTGAINGLDALQFDGIDDYFDLATDDSISSSSSGFEEKSISAVFQTSGDVTTRQFLYEQGGATIGLSMYIQDEQLYAGAYSSTSGLEGDWMSVAVEKNTTYVVTYDFNAVTGDAHLYVNGEYVNSVLIDSNLSYHVGSIGLGALHDESQTHEGAVSTVGTTSHFEGKIGEFSQHNVSINGSDVVDLHAHLMNKWLGTPTTLDYVQANSHNIQILVNDAAGNSFIETLSIDVDNGMAANQSVPVGLTTNEDTPLTFTSGTATEISVSDSLLSEDSLMRVALSVNDGVLTLFQITGLTLVQGNGTSSLVIDGTESDINAALNGMTFTPDTDFNGVVTLDMTTALAANLEGHYTFDDSSADDQAAGTNEDGTLVGNATTFTDLQRGEVLSLDGDRDYVEINSYYGEPTNVTLAAWVNVNDYDTAGASVITLGENVILWVAQNDEIRGSFYNGSSWHATDIENLAGSLIGTGWHHLAYTVNDVSKTQTLYLNGEVVAQTTHTEVLDYSTANSVTRIGAHAGTITNGDFDGLIDDARIYSRALSTREIATLGNGQGPSQDQTGESVVITVNTVNDEPTIANLGGDTLNYSESDGAVVIDQSADALVADVDSSNFDAGTLTVSFTAGSDNAEDVLSIVNQGTGVGQIGISGSEISYENTIIGTFTGGASGNDLVITFDADADVVAVSALVQVITYENSGGDAPTAGNKTVQYVLTDGDGGTSADVDTTVSVTAVNNIPTIVDLGGEILNYSEGNGAVVIDQSADALVADVDSSNFDAGTLTVSFTAGSDNAEDVLSIVNQGTGSGQIGISGSDVTYEGTVFGSVAGGASGSDLVVSFDADADAIEVSALVQAITYENTDNDTPTTGNRTVRFVLTDGDGGTSANVDTTVSVTAVNDIPTLLHLDDDTLNYSEGDGAVVIDQPVDALVADVDSSNFDTGTLTVSFAAGSDNAEDVLSIVNQGTGVGQIGISRSDVTYEGTVIGSVAGGASGTDLVVSFDADADAIAVSALVQAITYENTDNDTPTTGNRTISFVLADGDGGTSANVDTTVSVTAVNDIPTIVNLGSDTLNYSEGDGAVVIDQPVDALVADVDTSNFDSGTLTVFFAAGGDNAEDVLSIVNQGTGVGQIGISGNNISYENTIIGTFTGGASGTDLLITFDADADTVAVSALVRAITYENTDGNAPTTGDRTVRYVLTDSDGGSSINVDTTVSVSAVNDAPTITNLSGDTLNYKEGDGAVVIDQSANALVADFDSNNFNAGNLTVSSIAGGVDAEDVLSIANYGAGTEQISISDIDITYDGTVIGSFFGGANGSDLVITLNVDANATAVSALIQAITYENIDGDTPTEGNRTVRYVLTDGDGGTSTNLDTIVSVDAVNDEQVLAVNTGTTVAEGSTNNTISSAMLHTVDVDNTDVQLVYTVDTATENGTLRLSGTALGLNDTFTQTDIDGGLITYDHNGSQTESDRIGFTVDDGAGASLSDIFGIIVTNVNDVPVNSVPAHQVVNENMLLAIMGISVSDDDGNLSTVQLSVDNGTLNVSAGTTTATISAGSNGSSDLTLAGSQADINTVLSTLTYQGNLNYNGSDTLTVLSTDNTAANDSDMVAINVISVNEAPTVLSSSTMNVEENQTSVQTITASDVDGGSPTYSIVGGADQTLFVIDEVSGALSFNIVPNFESPSDMDKNNVYSVNVAVTDAEGDMAMQSLTVSVSDVNEVPVITSALSVNVDENQTHVVAVTSSDGDTGDITNYRIAGGSDAENFFINEQNGILTFNVAPDFEEQSRYEVAVSATDSGGLSDVQLFTINVDNVNEAPIIINSSLEVIQGFRGEIAKIVAVDPDTGDELTFQLISEGPNVETAGVSLSEEGFFSTGALDPGTYQFAVKVIDSMGLEATTQLTLYVEMSDSVGLGAANLEISEFTDSDIDNNVEEIEESASSAPVPENGMVSSSISAEDNLTGAMIQVSNSEPGLESITEQTAKQILETISVNEFTGSKANDVDGFPEERLQNLEFGSRVVFQLLIDQLSENDSALIGSLSSFFGTSTVPLSFSMELVQQLDLDRADFELREAELLLKQSVTTTASAVISATLSIGFASWMFQSGILVASAIGTAPLWRSMDPMPILAAGDRNNDDDDFDK